MLSKLPPLNAIRFFEVTTRHMSFKKAAEELCVTPAAVSHQIKCLEESLGVPLFVRTKGTIELTDAGLRFLPCVRAGIDSFHRAVKEVRQVSGQDVLVMTAGPAFVTKWLLPRLAQFRHEYADIEVRIVAALGLNKLEQEGIDLAIRFGRRPKDDTGAIPLVEETIVPMCSPDLIAQYPQLMTAEGLKRCALIHDNSLKLVSDDAPGWDTWFEATGMRGVAVNRGLRFNQADHALQSAVEGNGVILGRTVLAAHDLDAGRLVVPRGPALRTDLWFQLLLSQRAAERPVVQSFRRWLLTNIDAADSIVPVVLPR